LGASWIATGHYARLRRLDGEVRLLKAADSAKDQSYFLHQVPGSALAKTLFPLGELHKHEVRRRAHAAGLPVFDKPDSTGICFIGERPFEEFLGRYLHRTPGPIENDAGEVIGEHRGLAIYTLGQRSGLRIGGRAGSAAAPWYVAAKDPSRNALVVVQNPAHPLLLSEAFDVEYAHWLGADWPALAARGPVACTVKTRYRQNDLACVVRVDDRSVRVALAQPARAVTPGQYAVFYDGEVCLGGGVIARPQSSRSIPAETAIADMSAHIPPTAHRTDGAARR
jgi:tRNA-uridine 2-sulfurtransferase